jgi:mono/diheme cytochrome c family protein
VRRLAIAVVAALMVAGPVAAQDVSADQAAAGLKVWKERGGCFNCHGDFGQGGEGGHFPAGPNLRATQLDRDTVKDVISCGLPGTPMPYNLAGAYTETPCYGDTTGPVADGAVPGASLQPAEIDDLVAYLFDKVVGKRRITKQECTDYYGDPNAVACADYR